MGSRPGNKILKGVWRVCPECGHVGQVMKFSHRTGVPCCWCRNKERPVLVYSETRPVLPVGTCSICGVEWVDFGDSLKYHEDACMKFQQVAEAFFKEHPPESLTLKDIFKKEED